MILGFDFVNHPFHGARPVDDKGLAVNAVILPAHEFFGPPDPVGFDDFFIGISKKIIRQVCFSLKFSCFFSVSALAPMTSYPFSKKVS